MRKILILLAFLCFFVSSQARAQCYGYYCGSSYTSNYGFSGFNYGYGYYNPYLPKSYQAAYGIYQFFGALNEGITLLEQSHAQEEEIAARRSALENYKSVKNYYTVGIPPFANIAPDGKPRSSKITFQDVESIRWNAPLSNTQEPAPENSTPLKTDLHLKKQ